MKFVTLFVLAVGLVASVLAAPDDTPYEKKGIFRKIAHSPITQLTGQALTGCLPDVIKPKLSQVLLSGINCAKMVGKAAVQGGKISLQSYNQRKLNKAAKQ